MSSAPRARQLSANLAAVRARIAAAARAAGRDPAEITLIAVSKTFPAADVATLLELGVTEAGENRDQEAAPKVAQVRQLAPEWPVRWHFLGQLQRKKANSVASYADVVHSLDRTEVVDALSRAAVRAGRRLDGLVQVNLAASPPVNLAASPPVNLAASPDRATGGRGGVPPDEVVGLAEHIHRAEGLRLAGVMALAPYGPGADPAAAFARLALLAAAVRDVSAGADVISAGMSGDLEAAIMHGATHVRVGTALFGGRPIGSEDVR